MRELCIQLVEWRYKILTRGLLSCDDIEISHEVSNTIDAYSQTWRKTFNASVKCEKK